MNDQQALIDPRVVGVVSVYIGMHMGHVTEAESYDMIATALALGDEDSSLSYYDTIIMIRSACTTIASMAVALGMLTGNDPDAVMQALATPEYRA